METPKDNDHKPRCEGRMTDDTLETNAFYRHIKVSPSKADQVRKGISKVVPTLTHSKQCVA